MKRGERREKEGKGKEREGRGEREGKVEKRGKGRERREEEEGKGKERERRKERREGKGEVTKIESSLCCYGPSPLFPSLPLPSLLPSPPFPSLSPPFFQPSSVSYSSRPSLPVTHFSFCSLSLLYSLVFSSFSLFMVHSLLLIPPPPPPSFPLIPLLHYFLIHA